MALLVRIDIAKNLDPQFMVSPMRLVRTMAERGFLAPVVATAIAWGLPRLTIVLSRPASTNGRRREVEFDVTPAASRVVAAWTLASSMEELMRFCRGSEVCVAEKEIVLLRHVVWKTEVGLFVPPTAPVTTAVLGPREIVPGFNAWPSPHGFCRLEVF